MTASLTTPKGRLTTVTLWTVAAAGAALALYQWAGSQPLWLDEQMIAINVRERGFAALAGKLSLDQSAPYGWLVLERTALLLFGPGERSMRLVPMLFGVGTIATAFWIGRRWLAPFAASMLMLICSLGQWISYSFAELKQYSADACLALALPALGAWAVDTDRIAVWWFCAAVAQLFANGALFVAPLVGVAIVALVFQRRGAAAALRAAVPAAAWFVVFAINYVIVLRPARTSEFLQTYWQQQFPPTADGVAATVGWIAAQLAPFATKPAGTRVGLLLWIAAVAGFALATRRARVLALTFATVPLAGFLLTTLHFVPFYERLVLWIVPAMYVGVALLADRAVRPKPDTTSGSPGPESAASGVRRTLSIATGTIAIAIALAIAVDIVYVGIADLRFGPATTNHRLDDRSAVRWLASREQPGDVWVTTHLALPAIWWYAPEVGLKEDTTAATDATNSSGVSGFGRTIVEVGYVDPGPGCDASALAQAIAGARRVLVFTGFHFDDVPKSFDDLLMERLTGVGQITAYRGFGDVSRATIVDTRPGAGRGRGDQVRGCVSARPASRW